MSFRHVTAGSAKALVTIALMAMAVAVSGQSPEIKKALRYIDIEQPSKGIAALEQLSNSNPTNTNAMYYAGLAHLRTGARDKALQFFEKGIKTNEKDGLNYAGKGHVRLLEKNITDAKSNLEKALSLSKSKDVQVLKAVGEAYLQDSKFLLDAINALNKAKSINGSDPDVHILLGDALLMQNQQQGGEAVSSYERAAKADPKSGKPHYKVGKIFQRARNNEEAIKHYTQAVTVDPEYAPAYKELGQMYYVQKMYDKAVEAYEKYLPLSEKPNEAKFQYAFFLAAAKQYDKAEEIFKEVTSNPNVPAVAWKYYARLLTDRAKPADDKQKPDAVKTDAARKAFEKYFQMVKPEEIEATDFAYYGDLQLYLKTPEGDSIANEYFAKSLALDSADLEVLEKHADTYFKRKKYPEAAVQYKKLLALKNPPSTAHLFALGRSYFYNLQFQQADSAFTKVAERTPNMTVGWEWAAKARQQIDTTGVMELANPMYDSLIAKASANPDKYKKQLIDSYMYFASFYLNVKPDVNKAKGYLEKILALDPTHARAKEAIRLINEPPPQQQPKKGGKK